MKGTWNKIVIFIGMLVAIVVLIGWIYRCYPKQVMPVGEEIIIKTPHPEIYHNDCLHPCIRYDEVSKCYYMVQTPWFQDNDSIENPILYTSTDGCHFSDGKLILSTPQTGYNSDPCLYVENGRWFMLWREYGTPYCDSIGVSAIVFGANLCGDSIANKCMYTTAFDGVDAEICPIILKTNMLRESGGGMCCMRHGMRNYRYVAIEVLLFGSQKI